MGWAEHAIKKLQSGESVQIRPRGHSMTGKVNDGDLVTLSPCLSERIAVDDIVLCRVHGREYLHLVKAINQGRFLIGNNRGGINGWINANSIFGIATQVE